MSDVQTDAFPMCAPWVTEDDLELCGGVPDGCDGDALALNMRVASYILYLQSRRRYPGICTKTVTPCAVAPASGIPWVDGWEPSWGVMQSWGWCCNPRHSGLQCGCGSGPSQVTLGAYPVRGIVAVEVDGVTLDADEYRVLGERWLLRMADADGNAQCWPTVQRLDLPLGAEGTWGVTLQYGTAPPEAGVLGAAEFTRQLCLACVGSTDCSLPARVQTVARQGMTLAFLDPMAFITAGLVGTPLADAWLTAERAADREGAGAMFINPDDHVRSVPVPVEAS